MRKRAAYVIYKNMKTKRNIVCLLLAGFVLLSSTVTMPASAYTESDRREINEKIAALQEKINGYEAKASELSLQADNLSNQIAILQNEQANLRTQIELKQAEHEQIVGEIEVVQQRIEENSDTVGYIIAEYYYNDGVSLVERLASTKSFSAFVDEEVRLSGVGDTLAEIIEENKQLKEELTIKKHNAEELLADMDTQKKLLEQKEAEQAALLVQTQSSYKEYAALKNQSDTEMAALRKQQQEILADLYRQYGAGQIVAGDPSKGGYPYSQYCPQQQDAFADRWGMYICECVSYAAWKVYQTYGYMPNWSGRGNANQWAANARAAGYEVSNTPKVGSVGVTSAGYWGHVVWVEAVSGDRVYISQYNYGTPGEYSEMWVNKSMYQYIYFR